MEFDESFLEWVPYLSGITTIEYPVLSRNVPLGTYARIGVGYRRSHKNRLRACAYPAGIHRRSRGASTPLEIPGGC